MKHYDYLIVGCGLFGSVVARELTRKRKTCLVIDKRNHIGGNIYTEKVNDIVVHKYGAHIFHTNNKYVWDYINSFAEFNRYTNSPLANYKGKLYNLPFNMNTFYQMWGVRTPAEALSMIETQRLEAGIEEPQNLEEQAISLVGRDIYEKLIKGYTEKQWGRSAVDLPAFIIQRLPVRFTFDNNYFDARYQGIPIGGYNPIIKKMLSTSDVLLKTEYKDFIKENPNIAEKTIYTGIIDEYFDYQLGVLEYRSVMFDTKVLECDNYQGCAVMSFTERDIPYTRIIEHKHFEFGCQPKTVVSFEYSREWKPGDEPYYPINDEKNSCLYQKYKELAENTPNVVFAGRLGEYKYYDMDKVIEAALHLIEKEIK